MKTFEVYYQFNNHKYMTTVTAENELEGKEKIAMRIVFDKVKKIKKEPFDFVTELNKIAKKGIWPK